MRIGVDIGGTNTDAVLVNAKGAILTQTKKPTTQKIQEGFEAALSEMLLRTEIEAHEIKEVFLGTTHATNALLQQRDLFRVGVIRLAGHHPVSLPSCYGWPQEMRTAIYVDTVNIDGGFECYGKPITRLCRSQVREAAEKLLGKGAESLAIVGVFSPLNSSQEREVKEELQAIVPHIPVSLSHEIGGIGFLERENSTILNAALKKVMTTGFSELQASLKRLAIPAALWICQNNGSVIDLERAIEYPVLTISAGPTNSFIGGTKLLGMQNAVVVDIGGTSTDVGIVHKGYPRRCMNNSQIGGVTLNFSMPDVQSIALGGGSHINRHPRIEIGPKSCARRITQEARAFGGSQLTLTDIALSLGYLAIPGTNTERIGVEKSECWNVMREAFKRVEDLIEKIRLGDKELPVILIGGGASLFPSEFLSEHFLVPEYAHVANAYGAALAEISATIDTVVSLESRQDALEKLQEEVLKKAVENGANKERVQIVDLQILPYHYVPNKMARVIVSASG